MSSKIKKIKRHVKKKQQKRETDGWIQHPKGGKYRVGGTKEKPFGFHFGYLGKLPTDDTPKTKYVVKCKDCGRESYYHRMCPSVKRILEDDIVLTRGITTDLYNGLQASGSDYIVDNYCQVCRENGTEKHGLYVIQNW